ncbi:hypothetical protein [Marinobacter sp. SS21]|uniref:hypothetical protein n=1 Tax=Marinobacter sp. SS21 TaxID=2979460 RepID=UPI00232D3593|nr:hypothetical protein [Marinobacter sp. SS21]MDC0662936.1 hypothetical protein [Marinobacter sp. SS21]
MAIKPIPLLALLLGLWITPVGATSLDVETIATSLRQPAQHYRPLSASQLAQLEQGFDALLRADADSDTAAVRQSLEALGLRWHALDDGVLLLSDAEGNGIGHYLIRRNASSSLLLQAPHQFYDRHTGELAIELFRNGDMAVLALNSAHRRTAIDGRSGHADIAHLNDTPFAALTRAFVRHHPQGSVVQLHGFAADKRTSAAGRSADIIVSSGQRWLLPAAQEVASCLMENGPWQVRRYPLEVGELGGTTNTQGALLRQLGHGRFVHLELAREVRERLRSDPQTRSLFNTCLHRLEGP